MIKHKKFKRCHYLFIDEYITIPYRFKINEINIWILKNPNDVLFFNKEILFLR